MAIEIVTIVNSSGKIISNVSSDYSRISVVVPLGLLFSSVVTREAFPARRAPLGVSLLL
jgi:hypothetical protein